MDEATGTQAEQAIETSDETPAEMAETAEAAEAREAEARDAQQMRPDPAAAEPPESMSPERRARVEKALAFGIEAAQLCADLKCRDVRVLDVAGLSPVTDVLVLATGASPRQMRSVGVRVEEAAEPHGLESIIGFKRSTANESWIAIDLIDLVIHVFDEEAREFYDLDGLWGDAREVQWARDE